MGFLETDDLASADSFRRRLKVCLVKVAGTVLAQSQGEMQTAQYSKRVALCQNVFRDPASIVDAFIWPVLANVSIANAGLDAPDADLEYQVTQVWDQVAGVSQADRDVPTS